MSTNTDTVLKLSEALTELIAAYEKLQKENDELSAKNQALQNELDEIEKDKESLESNFNQLNESSEKQETNINSMLGKIESLLGVSKAATSNDAKPEQKELQDIVVEEVEEPVEETIEQDEAAELEENIFNTPAQHTGSDVSDIALNGAVQPNVDVSITKVEEKITVEPKNEEEDDNKLDLNRMASLLNGFNK